MTATTTPTIETTSPPLETPPSPTPETSQANRLKGNIARLPKEVRDMINMMIEDGLPHHVLIDELGEAGQGLEPRNLADWVQGRYQDYLKNRQDIEHAKSQMEFATDLLRELGKTDPSLIYRACSVLVAHQMFNAIQEFGDAALSDMLRANPANYLRLLNTFCNMTNSTLKLEDHRICLERRQDTTDAALPLTQGC